MGLLFLILAGPLFPFVTMSTVYASSPPVGTCFPTPSVVTITTAIYWSNLLCNHSGDIILTGTGSLTMINSSLDETGIISANQNSELNTQSSIITLTSISPTFGGLNSTGVASILFNSTHVNFPANAIISVEGKELYAYNSTLSMSNSTQGYPVRFQANFTNLISSQIREVNVTGIFLGNSSSLNSITKITSTSITDTGSNINQSMRVFGTSSVEMLGSTIQNLASSQSSNNALTFLSGGSIEINKTQIVVSDQGFIGFSTNTTSTLNIVASSGIGINQSKLISGEGGLPGLYQESQLSLTSNTNITVIQSTIQSEASQSSINIVAITPPLETHYVTMNQSLLETNQSPGSVNIAAGYGLILNSTKIDVASNTLFLKIYELWAVDSNITSPLTFSGGAIQVAYLYNTTSPSKAVLTSATFYEYSWLIVHSILEGRSSMGNATIDVVNPTTNGVDATATTNSSGWVKMAVLQEQLVSSVLTTVPYYVVEASGDNLRSSQMIALSNETTHLTLSLDPLTDANYSQLNYFTYALLFGLAAPSTTVSLYTNSYPLNFYNNATFSELDFYTVGSSGYNFTFVFAYPSNFSISALIVKIDGIPLSNLKTESNSSGDILTFSIPSGQHRISIAYIPPIAPSPSPNSPFLFPGYITVLAVVLIVVIGATLLIVFVRRKDKHLPDRVPGTGTSQGKS